MKQVLDVARYDRRTLVGFRLVFVRRDLLDLLGFATQFVYNVEHAGACPLDHAEVAEHLRDLVQAAGRGPLSGMKLVGFAIWERRSGSGRNVTFPARQYSVNGDRRSFALLRPKNGDVSAQEAVRDLILEAFSASEAQTD